MLRPSIGPLPAVADHLAWTLATSAVYTGYLTPCVSFILLTISSLLKEREGRRGGYKVLKGDGHLMPTHVRLRHHGIQIDLDGSQALTILSGLLLILCTLYPQLYTTWKGIYKAWGTHPFQLLNRAAV
ncbi:hypothetical protein KQX54_004138 [Cotesia glomerata]|uniref:Uncharacterized protein n=1 Tax=Cotesia glomerata TaxID=32391 RepID=A0AAV7ICQ9_COTGL|nr:hypothetical protein KQX54_004138 [Cotesia glomerata]